MKIAVIFCLVTTLSCAMEKEEKKDEGSSSEATIGLSLITYPDFNNNNNTALNSPNPIPPPMASISSREQDSSGTSLPTYTNYYKERAEEAERNKKLFRERFTEFMYLYVSIAPLSLKQEDLVTRYRTLDLGYKNFQIDDLMIYVTLAAQTIGEHVAAGKIKKITINENNFTLRTLNLGGNLLKKIPSELSEFKQTLNELNLNDNQLEYFPDVLDDLVNLTVLRLRNNKIREIPEYHFKNTLTHLTHLDLADNQLTSIPRGLKLLPNLKECLLYGNPHESIGAFMFRNDKTRKNVFITIDPRSKKQSSRESLLPAIVPNPKAGRKGLGKRLSVLFDSWGKRKSDPDII